MDYDEGPVIGGAVRAVHAVGAPAIAIRRRPIAWSRRAMRTSAGARRSGSTRVREEHQRAKLPPKYDRRCREPQGQAEARAEAEAAGITGYVVRFKTPLEGSVTLHDAIHGETTFDLATLDDFVILKSDGYPTYHLAYIVDDDDMRISHVLRGDEWISSAPRHLLMYARAGHRTAGDRAHAAHARAGRHEAEQAARRHERVRVSRRGLSAGRACSTSSRSWAGRRTTRRRS